MKLKNGIKGWLKKGSVLLLAVCLLLSVSASVMADSEDMDETLSWEEEDLSSYEEDLFSYEGDLFSEAQLEPPKAQRFTPVDSKKGLQFGESLDDAISLGIKHCLFNVNITELMDASGNQLEYDYNGKTYVFNLDAFERWGSLFSQLQDAGIALTVEFLLPWEEGQTDLIHPAARTPGHNYYAWNISSSEDQQRYAALFSCIAEEFNGRQGLGCIYNYIIGNEVNAHSQWHYTGSDSVKENANLYADTFQIVYTAVKKKCADARVSICLEHSWNTEILGQVHSGKSFLDTFAARLLEKHGNPDFAISYHAYSEPLTEADFWNNSKQRVKDSEDSPCITMENIEQLTKYVKDKYGMKTRIMLTEQGFSSHGADGQIKQAAALAYAYYKAEFNDMIDCIIFRCQADAPREIAHDGLYMGLWTEGMGSMKLSHDIFKYMDTPQAEEYTKSCRQYLGIQDWSQLISNYDKKKFAQ